MGSLREYRFPVSYQNINQHTKVASVVLQVIAWVSVAANLPAISLAGTANWVGPNGSANVVGGNWNTASNWDIGRVPQSSDDVVFPTGGSGPYLVIMNANPGNCRSLQVHCDATLRFDASRTLRIGDAAGQTSRIDGLIWLYANGASLRFMQDHTIQPLTANTSVNMIWGNCTNSVIEDDPANPRTLTIATNGTGTPWIAFVSTFDLSVVNNGIIETGSCVSKLKNGTFTGTGRFQVSGGTLRFESSAAATGLATDIAISGCGVLEVEADVRTSGQLTFGQGSIEVCPGNYFIASQ